LAALIVYLPTPLFLFLCGDHFIPIRHELVDVIKEFNGHVFVYQDNLAGDFSTEENPGIFYTQLEEDYENDPFSFWKRQRFGLIALEPTVDELFPQVKEFLDYIKYNVTNLIGFSTRNDVTLQIVNILNRVSSGEFLKILISNGKYQAEQVEKLIKLLEKYLQSAEKVDFQVNTQRIESGTIITFNSISGIVNLENLNKYLENFQNFMEICQNNPLEAENILISNGFNKQNATYTVQRYLTEYKRIVLDIKQEYEHKMLLLKQKLEQDTFEMVNIEYSQINNQMNPLEFIKNLSKTNPIIINMADSMINNNSETQTILNQALNGDIEYNELDKELLEVFEKYADSLKKLEFEANLAELKSNNVNMSDKKTAKQKITSFLLSAGSKFGENLSEALIKNLIAYLEQLAKGTI
jgi:hypothetical protein